MSLVSFLAVQFLGWHVEYETPFLVFTVGTDEIEVEARGFVVPTPLGTFTVRPHVPKAPLNHLNLVVLNESGFVRYPPINLGENEVIFIFDGQTEARFGQQGLLFKVNGHTVATYEHNALWVDMRQGRVKEMVIWPAGVEGLPHFGPYRPWAYYLRAEASQRHPIILIIAAILDMTTMLLALLPTALLYYGSGVARIVDYLLKTGIVVSLCWRLGANIHQQRLFPVFLQMAGLMWFLFAIFGVIQNMLTK